MVSIATTQPPFCLPSLVQFLQRFPYPMGEKVTGPTEVSRLFEDEEKRLVQIRLGAEGLVSDRLISPATMTRARQVFELDSRVREELTKHRRSDWLGRAVQLPVLRWADSFAAMISSVIEQQTSWRQALKSIDLAFRLSRRRAGELALFPTPEEFIERPEILDGMPITYRRKDLIRELSSAVIDEPDFFDAMCTDLEQAESRLVRVKGIGPWTARVFLSKRFGFRRAVPTNDVALQRAAAHFILDEQRKMTQEELAEKLSEFGALAGEAAHRLLIRWVLETYPLRSGWSTAVTSRTAGIDLPR